MSTPGPLRWYHRLAHLWGGAFLVNAVPHMANGMSGRSFPSPFATPPGVGLSSPEENVTWALLNLCVAYVLLVQVGDLRPRRLGHVLAPAVGMATSALLIAGYFGGLGLS